MDDYRAEAKARWTQQNTATLAAGTRSGASGASSSTSGWVPPPAAAESRQHMSPQQWLGRVRCSRSITVLGIGLGMAIFTLGQRFVFVVVLSCVCVLLHARVPTSASFEPFFRWWFTEIYFPRVSQKVQRELRERAQKETCLFGGLAKQFQGWVMGQTEALQAAAWYELHVRHYCLPARFGEAFIMRTASVNLGSRDHPCMVTFWGIADRWMLNPLQQIDFQNVSILDEIDRQQAAAKARAAAV